MTKKYLNEEETTEPCEQDIQSHNLQCYDTETDCVSEEECFYNKCPPQPLYELSGKEDKIKAEYAILRIGISTLIVSSEGRIRKSNDMFSSSIGCALPGTPYRTYVVEIEKNKWEEYFVHDLVWRAFNGEPPEGWEVRHKFWEAKQGKEFYDNSLSAIEIYPSTVTYLPSKRNSLPLPLSIN